MKRRSIFISLFTFSIVFALLISSFAVNAAGKLSEYDFSKWILSATQKIDFEDKTKDAEYNAPPQGWVYQNVAGDKGFVREAGGSKYFELNGFTQLVSSEPVSSKYYVFSVDVKCAIGQTVGIFARTAKEKIFLKSASEEGGNDGDYFEQDRSANIDGQQNIGATGFYLKPKGDKLHLYIKVYDAAEPAKIGNKVYILNAGVDFATAFHKITLVDDGASVSIFVADALVAKIAFSVSKKYSAELKTRTGDTAEDYFSKVVVTDAAGTELGTHTNAIFAVKSNMAIGSRNNQILIDNMEVKLYNDVNPQTSDAGMAFVFAAIMSACLALVVLRRKVKG